MAWTTNWDGSVINDGQPDLIAPGFDSAFPMPTQAGVDKAWSDIASQLYVNPDFDTETPLGKVNSGVLLQMGQMAGGNVLYSNNSWVTDPSKSAELRQAIQHGWDTGVYADRGDGWGISPGLMALGFLGGVGALGGLGEMGGLFGGADAVSANTAAQSLEDAAMGNWLTAPEAVSTASPLAEVAGTSAGSGLSGLDPLEYAMQQSGFEYLPEAQSFGAPVASATPTYAAEPINEGSLWENISTPFKQANSILDQALNTPEARLIQRAGQVKSLYDKLQGPDTSALERMQQQLQAYRTTGQQSQSFNPSREFGYANFNPRYGRI